MYILIKDDLLSTLRFLDGLYNFCNNHSNSIYYHLPWNNVSTPFDILQRVDQTENITILFFHILQFFVKLKILRNFYQILAINWRCANNKSAWSNVFWYVKVCIFWKCIQYTIHWDKTQILKKRPSFFFHELQHITVSLKLKVRLSNTVCWNFPVSIPFHFY